MNIILSKTAAYVVGRKEAGADLPEIDAALRRQGLTTAEIDAALAEAADYFRRKGEAQLREAAELEDLQRAAKAPGAETVGDGLRQRARTGDEEAVKWMTKLGIE